MQRQELVAASRNDSFRRGARYVTTVEARETVLMQEKFLFCSLKGFHYKAGERNY